jgi:hypothetical protein
MSVKQRADHWGRSASIDGSDILEMFEGGVMKTFSRIAK